MVELVEAKAAGSRRQAQGASVELVEAKTNHHQLNQDAYKEAKPK